MSAAVLNFNTAAEIDYEYIAALKAETVVLSCNSSSARSSEVKWTHRPTGENNSYTYANVSIPGRYLTEGRFSIVTSYRGEQSLRSTTLSLETVDAMTAMVVAIYADLDIS